MSVWSSKQLREQLEQAFELEFLGRVRTPEERAADEKRRAEQVVLEDPLVVMVRKLGGAS